MIREKKISETKIKVLKNYPNLNINKNIILLLSLMLLVSGLFLTLIDNSFTSDALLVVSVLLSGYNFMKFINQ